MFEYPGDLISTLINLFENFDEDPESLQQLIDGLELIRKKRNQEGNEVNFMFYYFKDDVDQD